MQLLQTPVIKYKVNVSHNVVYVTKIAQKRYDGEEVTTCFAASRAARDSKLMAANCPPCIYILLQYYIIWHM